MLRRFFCLSLVVVMSAFAQAQSSTFTSLYSFTGAADGAGPATGLVQAADGNYYGTTSDGYTSSNTTAEFGTIFRLTPGGVLTTLHTFSGNLPDGARPSGLTQGPDGALYGVTEQFGTVFRMTLTGEFSTISDFAYTSAADGGVYPFAALTLGSDGLLYGSTTEGGANSTGILFSVSTTGAFTLLNSGLGTMAPLVQASDGNFYGLEIAPDTCEPSTGSCGTVFEMTPAGAVSTLYSFSSIAGDDGDYAYGGVTQNAVLVEGADAGLHGTTASGGASTGDSDGTFFDVSLAGQITVLSNFCCAYESPGITAGLFLASDGNYYGASVAQVSMAGLENVPVIFSATPQGTLSLLYDFTPAPSGYATPAGMLIQGSDGNFYGVTSNGYDASLCSNGCGSIYRMAMSPALAAPVQISAPSVDLPAGAASALSFSVSNAFSTTMQQCYLFASTGGTLTALGQVTGALSQGVYSGTVSVTPTTGIYTYALTCGGIESGFTEVRVGTAKANSTPAFTTNSPVVLGNIITLTATPTTTQYVAPLTGSVSFSSGSLTLGTIPLNGSGTASLNVEAKGISAGKYPITASYSGDANYQASSTTRNVVVLGYATATTLTTSVTKLTQGQRITLSSTVSRTGVTGTPMGSVAFYYGTTALGSATLKNGSASITAATNGTVPAGTYSITAKYSGDASDQASPSAAVSVTVLAATSTALTISPNPVPANSAVSFTAKVKETYGAAIPTGMVTLTVGTYSVGSAMLDGTGTAVVNLSDSGFAPGTYPVTAAYSGDSLNAPSGVTKSVTVQ